MTWDSAYTNPLGFEGVSDRMPDEQEQAFMDAARERYEYCMKIARIFNTKHGKEVFQVWRENTIEAGTWSPSLANNDTLEKANAHAYAREGQNAFIKELENCIKIANECKTLDDFCAKINQLKTI